jgi:hypothetical protein
MFRLAKVIRMVKTWISGPDPFFKEMELEDQ